MYNVNDILARLQNGESAEAIAQGFADVLNQAITAQNEEYKKAQEAKRAAEVRAAKISDLTDIIDLVLDFVEHYYPEIVDNIDLEMEAEDVEYLVDELDKAMEQAKTLTTMMNNFTTSRANVTITPSQPQPQKKTALAEDAILTFLKSNGLV